MRGPEDDNEADLLTGLNGPQQAAVLHAGGRLLVVAGAGSGKTRVLTHRIAHLIRVEGVSPWSILAITFTNKAADEMRARVSGLLGERLGRTMWICTFHSACVRTLRSHAGRLGYERNFTIYDAADAQRLVAMCVKHQDLDPKRFAARSVLAEISTAKNELVTPAEFEAAASMRQDRLVAGVYAEYQRRLVEANAMDFDDLLVNTVTLLRTHADVLAEYAARFEHVLIDEYQDTNRAQYELSKLWSSGSGNLCAVGDSDQGVYSFRGADIRNILEFERDFPDATVIALEHNYRSTQQILDAANALIRNNAIRHDKRLFTERTGGDPVLRYEAESEHDEAAFVCTEIDRLVDEHGYRLGDMAVFYRTNAQSRVLEEVLVRGGIAYRVVGGTKFYDRREVKDALAYLRLLVNPVDEVSLRRVVNVPRRGIGDQTLARLATAAEANGLPLGEMVRLVDDVPGLGARARSAVHGFCEVLDDLQAELAAGGLPAALEATWERTGYAAELRAENSIEAQGRMENLQELLSVAQDFLTSDDAVGADGDPLVPEDMVRAFLESVSLVSETDELADADEPAVTSVTLMTLHNAKGLEFPVVFVTGMEEGVFPHVRSLTDPHQLEEERRLAYVGVTRAMDRIYLTHAVRRSLWGGTNFNAMSRFLKEIPEDLVRTIGGDPELTSWKRRRDEFRDERRYNRFERRSNASSYRGGGPWEDEGIDIPRDAVDDEPAGPTFGRGRAPSHAEGPGGSAAHDAAASFAPGDRVRHTRFGEGSILDVTGEGNQAVALVAFDAHPRDTKQIMLAPQWLRLEKV
ncbi:MAG: UvrD-helicase domain-containing protein [Acidimicrobiia bacterium]|nr:UvrD-helicase domain-containing protein [Acidimicrobiia bacterium]